jgi:hypothetical protein
MKQTLTMRIVYATVIIVVLFAHCKSIDEKKLIPEIPVTHTEPTKIDTPAVANKTISKLTDTVFFSKTESLHSIDDDHFECKGLKIIFSDSLNQFTCKTDAGAYTMQLTEQYSGPGFQLDKFENPKNADQYYLIVEAQGDPGTDWYLICKIENNKLVQKQMINEPRANSEETAIEKFLSIYEIGNQSIFQFKKKFVAGYSSVQKDMKQDKVNYYLAFPLK